MANDSDSNASDGSSTGGNMEETLPAEGVFHGDVATTGGPDEPLARGADVGRYTVLDRIGSGGMGVVYTAFDPQLDRRIALKVMHPGKGGTVGPGGRARLLREAQAMAKLSHPNVITVHDVGTYGDRVFVAMEFIEGGHLREWLGTEREWPEIVDAFVRAGRGLAAAHAAGLVHRDFKPDNVLMGRDGRVLVMDFGLARQTSQNASVTASDSQVSARLIAQSSPEVLLTRTGAMLGTPAYMAPEQHKGTTIGPHADQFSFSVALHEGLYGQRPFAGTSVTSLAMNVLEGNIRSPPRDTKVPGWLRDIVVRGLSTDPADRFASMDALLAELQRDPPQTRRPWLVGGITVGVAASITALYVGTRPNDEACKDGGQKIADVWSDAARQSLHGDLVGSGEPYAEATWSSVAPTLDAYTARWSKAYLSRCRSHNKTRKRAVRVVEDAGLLCLDDRRRDLSELISALGDAGDSTTVLESAVGATQQLRSPEECRDLPSDRRDIRLSKPTHRAVSDKLEAALSTARALLTTGRSEQALETVRAVVRGAETLEAPGIHAEALALAAEAQLADGQIGPAERDLRQAILSAASGKRGDLETRAWTTMVEVLALRQGLYDEGRRIALGAEAAIARNGDTPTLRARLLAGLGAVAQAEGRYDEALDHFERALTIREENLEPTDLRLAETLEGIGVALEGIGRFPDAIDHHNAALAIREQVLGAQHPLVARSLVRVASAMQGDGRYRAANGSLIRARMLLDPRADVSLEDLPEPGADVPALAADISTPHAVDLALCFDQLGLLRRGQQEYVEAAALHARAAALLEANLGPHNPAVGYAIGNLGLSLADQGRHEEALPHLRRVLQIWRALPGGHPDLGFAYLNLANSLWATGQVDGARAQYGRALTLWEEILPANHPYIAYALTGLARTQLDAGEHESAVELLERALELRNHEFEDRLNVAETSLLLARALWAGGQEPQRAIELAIVARDSTGAQEPTDHAALRRVLTGEDDASFTDQLVPAGLAMSNRHRPR